LSSVKLGHQPSIYISHIYLYIHYYFTVVEGYVEGDMDFVVLNMPEKLNAFDRNPWSLFG